jgi:glyoxylase-like metal-dependent hydrolase (beta-lactamase superfamily II)
VRVRALHADVLVLTSALLHLNALLVRGRRVGEGPLGIVRTPAPEASEQERAGESFLIDSPVLPEELSMLPSVLEQAGFPPLAGLLATHADWDHLLGRLAFPAAALGCAETSAQRLAAEPGTAQRELRAFDEELYLERPAPLALHSPQALPVPGRCEVGGSELELLPTAGHTLDGMAILVPWAGVLAAGDYLSPIEIPMLGAGGSVEDYLQTLERLRPLVGESEHVVPGHGPVIGATRALEVLEEDVAYLRDLNDRAGAARLPESRRSAGQRTIHERNAASLAAEITRREP